VFGSCVDYTIYAPSALTGTVSVQVALTDSPAAGDWKTVNVGGTDITVAAGKAVVVPVGGIRAMRLVSSSAEGSSRAFGLMGQIENSL
jgi:phage gp45-like